MDDVPSRFARGTAVAATTTLPDNCYHGLQPRSDAAAAAPRTRHSVSAVLITLNAEATLEATLAALDWCDEILVIDSGSTDNTLSICRRRGCEVQQAPFAGFGPQKQLAVLSAKHDWVFAIDADEVVSTELRQEVERVLSLPQPEYTGYAVRIPLVFMGRALRFGGEFHKRHLRLFNRRHGNFNDALVHERVVIDGPVGQLAGPIWHHSYRNLHHYFEKFNDYTSRSARQLAERGPSPRRWLVALRLPLVFLYLYIARGLILDGFPGFVWSALASFHRFVRHVKQIELEQFTGASSRAKPVTGTSAERLRQP